MHCGLWESPTKHCPFGYVLVLHNHGYLIPPWVVFLKDISHCSHSLLSLQTGNAARNYLTVPKLVSLYVPSTMTTSGNELKLLLISVSWKQICQCFVSVNIYGFYRLYSRRLCGS